MTRKYRSILVALVLFLGLMQGLTSQKKQSASKASTAAAAAKQKLSQTQKNLKARRDRLRSIKIKQGRTLADINRSQQELEEIGTKLRQTQHHLSVTKTNLSTTKRNLAQESRRLDGHRQALMARLAAAYQGESEEVLSFLFNAEDPLDFVTRTYYAGEVASSDMDLLQSYAASKERVAQQKRHLEKLSGRYQSLADARRRERESELAAKRQKEAIFQDLKQERVLAERLYAEMMAESRRLEAEIRRLTARPGTRVTPWKGALLRPIPGRVTSGYGMRMHPILKVNKLHTGIDIDGEMGDPIHASGGGVVLIAGWLRGYGKTVIVDHGGGISTLYGHCSELLVSGGQKVNQGQVIAKIGTTGLSTGTHLHWEKRVNGKPVNPY